MYYHFRLVLIGLFYTSCMCIFLCTETISVYAICAVNIFSFVIIILELNIWNILMAAVLGLFCFGFCSEFVALIDNNADL